MMALTSGSKESSSLMSWELDDRPDYQIFVITDDNCTKHPTVFTPRFRLGLSRKAGKKTCGQFLGISLD